MSATVDVRFRARTTPAPCTRLFRLSAPRPYRSSAPENGIPPARRHNRGGPGEIIPPGGVRGGAPLPFLPFLPFLPHDCGKMFHSVTGKSARTVQTTEKTFRGL